MMAIDELWLPPPADLRLPSDEVHVWRAPLDLDASSMAELQRTLATDELDRMARFYFQKDRDHFIVGRGLLRTILGRYLNTEPAALRFCYNFYGKPALATEFGDGRLRFNMSHAHGLALYAVTCDREIGVDVEYIRTDFACEEIAERFFSPYENAVLRALPADTKYMAFFTCWTRKEAYIKARGMGLSLALDQFDVALTPGEPAAVLNTREDPHEALRWSLQELIPGSGYVAALAVAGHTWRLSSWQWPSS
jgi:4'-phosphopantetheinyl transferase